VLGFDEPFTKRFIPIGALPLWIEMILEEINK
jgi:hypothetical protein